MVSRDAFLSSWDESYTDVFTLKHRIFILSVHLAKLKNIFEKNNMVSIAGFAHYAINRGSDKMSLQHRLLLSVNFLSKSKWPLWGVDCYREGRGMQFRGD